MKIFIAFILSLCKSTVAFILWLILTGMISWGLSHLDKEYYTQADTPHPRFKIATTTYPQTWQEHINHPKPLLDTPDNHCMDNCLTILDNGNYQYINDSPLIMTFSEYQINSHQVIPISFRKHDIGHIFLGMILSFLSILLLSYFYKIHQHHHKKIFLKNLS